jgi:hypothetical protein
MLILENDILNKSNYSDPEVFRRDLINKNNVIHSTNIYETDNKYEILFSVRIL